MRLKERLKNEAGLESEQIENVVGIVPTRSPEVLVRIR